MVILPSFPSSFCAFPFLVLFALLFNFYLREVGWSFFFNFFSLWSGNGDDNFFWIFHKFNTFWHSNFFG